MCFGSGVPTPQLSRYSRHCAARDRRGRYRRRVSYPLIREEAVATPWGLEATPSRPRSFAKCTCDPRKDGRVVRTDFPESSRGARRSLTSPSTPIVRRYHIVDDNETDDIISWTDGGKHFTIHDMNEFAAEILPKYFKHNNFSSFVRQLNSYVRHRASRARPAAGHRDRVSSLARRARHSHRAGWTASGRSALEPGVAPARPRGPPRNLTPIPHPRARPRLARRDSTR